MSRSAQHIAETDIYDGKGRRKYLTGEERTQFREEAGKLPLGKECFCLMHYFTGLRISEALELTPMSLDHSGKVVVIRCLKRRKDCVFRAVPIPSSFLSHLKILASSLPSSERLWSFSRKTGYRLIKEMMANAGITGPHACPKGLRHGFGIACAQKNIPLPTIAKWMGHSDISTTAIYLNAVGNEERQLAKRIW